MKQVLLMIALVALAGGCASFDPIVEKAIRKQLGKPKGKLTEAYLAQVWRLSLRSTEITDAGLKELAKFKQLKGLVLDGTKITVENAAELQKALPKCRIVHSYKKD